MAKGDTMVEHDFFRMEKEKVASTCAIDRRNSSARGIQSVISRINPQLLRSVIAPRAAAWPAVEASSMLFPSPPPSPMPILNPSSRSAGEISNGGAPLTIFYNGTVAVFDLPQDKADVLLKLAEEANDANSGRREKELLDDLNGDLLPLARRKSLQRFLAKRQQRLTVGGPYVKNRDMEGMGSATTKTSAAMSASSTKLLT